jgi:tetratricopeptide (TPR) repeat protein
VLRLVGFVVLVYAVAVLLARLPWVGPVFQRAGCLGIWIAALLVSWALSRLGQRLVSARRTRAEVRALAGVDTPHNHGKIGSLYLARGRARKALAHLETAAQDEPEVAEWHYRLGCALLELRRPGDAAEELARCTAIDAEHAYGSAQMRLAQALAATGRHEEALAALEVQEQNHGPSPESAYRRGLALKRAGRRDEARRAFAEVGRLASQVARYQRRDAVVWTLRARLAAVV